MGLTVTNTNTINLLSILNKTSGQQSDTLTRLSTGLRINKGSDDPAGLIALNALQSELTGVNSAITNNQRSDALLGVADGAIGEVSSLLTEIKTLVSSSTSSAGLSATELAANQAQIDAAIDSIDRIVRTTQFNGKRLLDGSFGIQTTGVDNTQISDVQVFSRGNTSNNVSFTVDVTSSATRATTTLVDTAGNTTSGATTVSITGTLGNATITIADGTSVSGIANQINLSKDLTGVSASVSGNQVSLSSLGFGSDEFVSVDVLSGGELASTSNTFTETSGNVTGDDAEVNVNGQAASVDGLTINFNGNGFSFQATLTEGFGTQTATDATFSISSTGGATFQLGSDSSTKSTIGIDALFAYKLGGSDVGGVLSDLRSGGSSSLLNDVGSALSIVDGAISDVSNVRGRIGGFQKFQIGTAINSLNATKTALTSAKSTIGDTDFAVETAELNRQNVLLNSSIALLGLANQQSSNILALL